jgi:crotonobetainyl-CoA:carnitine CoA-transferase CaiB-like acyl-CoA transferase
MDSALEGLKVLDLGHYIAGPWCSKMLADLGADVIKVERPDGGDPARRYGPFPDDLPHPEKSGLFLFLNMNKRGVTLNLKTDSGKGILKDLVQWADVVVENFSPRVMPALGLSYDELSSWNPRLIMTSITNFGQFGPYRDYKATDLVLYAMGVIMNISGVHEREPLAHAMEQAQKVAGRGATAATMAAVLQQAREGKGQHIDYSIMEAMNWSLAGTNNLYAYMGAITGRGPKEEYFRFFSNVPLGIPKLFRAKDGFVSFSAPGGPRADALSILAELLELPELNDPKYASTDEATEDEVARMVYGRTLELEKLPLFNRGMGREVVRGEARAAGGGSRRTVMSMVQTPDEVLESEQLLAREYFVKLDHPVAGEYTYPGRWFTMSETPITFTRPAPTLGQHNEEVYGEIGKLSRTDLTYLRKTGVI